MWRRPGGDGSVRGCSCPEGGGARADPRPAAGRRERRPLSFPPCLDPGASKRLGRTHRLRGGRHLGPGAVDGAVHAGARALVGGRTPSSRHQRGSARGRHQGGRPGGGQQGGCRGKAKGVRKGVQGGAMEVGQAVWFERDQARQQGRSRPAPCLCRPCPNHPCSLLPHPSQATPSTTSHPPNRSTPAVVAAKHRSSLPQTSRRRRAAFSSMRLVMCCVRVMAGAWAGGRRAQPPHTPTPRTRQARTAAFSAIAAAWSSDRPVAGGGALVVWRLEEDATQGRGRAGLARALGRRRRERAARRRWVGEQPPPPRRPRTAAYRHAWP